MDKIRILIVGNPEHREGLANSLLKEEDLMIIGDASDGPGAIKKTEHLLPDIIIMDIDLPIMDGISATEAITLAHPNIGVILIDEQVDNNHIKAAMLAGAGDILFWDQIAKGEVDLAIRRLFQSAKTRTANFRNIKVSDRKQNMRSPQVVTVFGAKGGAGKTTVAVNLAVAIARESKYKVVLVDLNLQFGDVVVYMDTKPRRTIAELVQERNQWDVQLVNSYLIEHNSGVKILPAPLRPDDAELVIPDYVEKIIMLLRQTFDFIIIDSPPYLSDALLTALDASNQIILLLPLDLPAVKNAKLCLNLLDTLHHSSKTKLVVNRGAKQFGVDMRDVEKTIDFIIAEEIPSDGNIVVNAANKGIPFVINHPQSAVSKAIYKIAQLVIKDQGYQKDLKLVKEKGNKSPLIKKLFS